MRDSGDRPVVEAALIDDTKSLDDGAIDFPMFAPGQWMGRRTPNPGFFDPAMKIGDYTPEQRRILLYAPAGELHAPPGSMRSAAPTRA